MDGDWKLCLFFPVDLGFVQPPVIPLPENVTFSASTQALYAYNILKYMQAKHIK